VPEVVTTARQIAHELAPVCETVPAGFPSSRPANDDAGRRLLDLAAERRIEGREPDLAAPRRLG
jgi:hypothetical protein